MMYSQRQSDRMSQNQSRIPTFQEDPEGFVVKCFQFQLELISKMTAKEITHAEGMKMLKEKFPTVVSDSEDDEDEEEPKEEPKETKCERCDKHAIPIESVEVDDQPVQMCNTCAGEYYYSIGECECDTKYCSVCDLNFCIYEKCDCSEKPKEQPKEEVEQYTECECCDRICYTGGVQYPNGYCCEDCEPEENSDDDDSDDE